MPVLPLPSPTLPGSIPSYPQAYNSIVSRSRASMGSAGGGNGLVIMVANDIDGVCAGRSVQGGEGREGGIKDELELASLDQRADLRSPSLSLGCDCRMLATLLTSDSIPHRMFPVEGYAELEERSKDLEQDNEVRIELALLLPSSPPFAVQAQLTRCRVRILSASSTPSSSSRSALSSPSRPFSSDASTPQFTSM